MRKCSRASCTYTHFSDTILSRVFSDSLSSRVTKCEESAKKESASKTLKDVHWRSQMIPHMLPQLAWPRAKDGVRLFALALRSAADCRVASSVAETCHFITVSRSDINLVCFRSYETDRRAVR